VTRVNAKQSIHVDPAATYFEQLSKAALVDILVDVLKREAGDEGHICRESEAKELAEPVLRLRGDKIPLSTEDQIAKARAASEARTIWRKAKSIAGV
jgi:hypothetical protein